MKTILEGCHNTLLGPPTPLSLRPGDGQLLPLIYNVNVLRLLAVLQWPVGKVIAVALLLGKPVRQIYAVLQSLRRRVTGWLLAPVTQRKLQRLMGQLFTLRRWHIVVGALGGVVLVPVRGRGRELRATAGPPALAQPLCV